MSTEEAIGAPRDEVVASVDGMELRAWHWARPEPRGVVVVSHGLGEHSGCYRHVAEVIGPAAGVDVLAFDFRGHGRSPGKRGLVRRHDELMADLRGALAWAERNRPGLPRFLLGHSNGGLVALRTVIAGAEGLAGLILSNPSMRLAVQVPRHKLVAAALLMRWAPTVTLATDLGPEAMTRDPEVLAARKLDALRHTRISAPMFYGMIQAGPLILAAAGSITLPTLILLGESDRVIDPRATVELFERLGSSDKTLITYPDLLHEPLSDLGRDRVLADLAAWLADRLPPARPPG